MSGREAALIAGMFLVTFGARYPILALANRFSLPQPVLDALRFIPPAVLAAIVAPALLISDAGMVDVALSNRFLVAGIVAAVVAWQRQNLLLTIVVGMAMVWIWPYMV